jgi:hypothetical protein
MLEQPANTQRAATAAAVVPLHTIAIVLVLNMAADP